jgi:hypothetical protein
MPNQNPCSSGWHGRQKESITFINPYDAPLTVCATTSTWPFVPASPITVPAGGKGGPGTVNVSIANVPNGTYTYDVEGCKNPQGGLPKEVTIP